MKIIRVHKKDSAKIFKATIINEKGKSETFIKKSNTKDYKYFWYISAHVWGSNIYKGKEEPYDDIWREYGFSTNPKTNLSRVHRMGDYDLKKNRLGESGDFHQRILINKVVPVEVEE